MDDTELQHALRRQLPALTTPVAPPEDAASRVRRAVWRRRRRARVAVGAGVAATLALVVLVPLAVAGGIGSDSSGDPADDDGVGRWEPIAPSPLSARAGSASVWTGEEMIVVGGNVGPPCPPTADCGGPGPDQLLADGAAYDPRTDTWRPIEDAPVPLTNARAAWTGQEMVVLDTQAMPYGEPGHTFAYDPDADAWRELEPPPNVFLIGGVWNGQELFYWQSEERAGSADWSLDPSTGRWTRLPDDPFDPTFDRAYVWIGDRFVFLGLEKRGGDDKAFQVAEYDPESRTWTRRPESPVGFGGVDWFFHQGYVVNPYEDPRFDSERPRGGAYDPATGMWLATPKSGHYVYDSCQLGPLGSAGDWVAPAGGVLYSLEPADTVVAPECPQLPEPAAAAWTGEQVVIWGGPNRAYKANTDLGLSWTPPRAGD